MRTQRWPTAWLMTDERLGERLGEAIDRAATRGAGIIVRHHASAPEQRRAIAEQVLARGATLGIARDVGLARELGAALVHNPSEEAGGLAFSLSVHDEAEAISASGRHPALVFISPVYRTRSHPGAPELGPGRALELMRLASRPAITLGGMDQARGEALMALGFSGWAGIDCWLRT